VRAQWPERFALLTTRIDRYEAALAAAGLDPRQLAPGRFTLGRVAGYVGKAALVLFVALAAALAGVVVHYPAYWRSGSSRRGWQGSGGRAREHQGARRHAAVSSYLDRRGRDRLVGGGASRQGC